MSKGYQKGVLGFHSGDQKSSTLHFKLLCSGEGGGVRTDQLPLNLHLSALHSFQVSSPQHPLWKPHQYVHSEAWDPPSHLLRLPWDPSENHFLSHVVHSADFQGLDLGSCFAGGGKSLKVL